MIKVINITKKPKYYSVTFTNEEILVPLDLMYKYNIKLNSEFNEKTYLEIKTASNYLYLKDLALKKLRNLVTTEELKNYLTKHGATEAFLKQLIFEFSEKKYLDDNLYTKLFIESKKNSFGPTYFYNKLKEKGILEYLIYNNLKTFDELTPIKNLVNTKLKGYKKYSNKEIKRKLKNYLLTKGFTYDVITNYIDFNLKLPAENNQLELAFLKLKKAYEKKYEANELLFKIKQKLYEKGFSKTSIDKLLNNMHNF